MPGCRQFFPEDPGKTTSWWLIGVTCYCAQIFLSPRWDCFTPTHYFRSLPQFLHQDWKKDHLERAHNARSSNLRMNAKKSFYLFAQFFGRREKFELFQLPSSSAFKSSRLWIPAIWRTRSHLVLNQRFYAIEESAELLRLLRCNYSRTIFL